MVFDDKHKSIETPNNIILNSRKKLSISGVSDVESFDESTVVLYTSSGLLIIKGEDLHIEKLSIDGGELSVEGRVNSLAYEDENTEKGGFFSRLFK